MAILKNITEKDDDFGILFDRDEYISDPGKTRLSLVGALRCHPDNFPKISRALKRYYGQQHRKMLRHFVVSLSPCDEKRLSDNDLMRLGRRISGFFKDSYVKFAVHTNTPHTHFHILVCNTQISDGKQLNMSDSNLSRFKEHCSTALRECGLEPILKLDTTNSGDPLEINEELFPKDLTQEEKVAILYDGTEKPRQVPYYENSRSVPIRNCGNIITVNVIVPFGTQGTMYFSRNGTPCVSFKPAADPGACNTAPQISSGNIGNTVNERYYRQLAENLADQDDSEPDWLRDEPDTLDDTGDVAELQGEVITSPESEYPEELLVDPFIVDSCLIDPFIIL